MQLNCKCNILLDNLLKQISYQNPSKGMAQQPRCPNYLALTSQVIRNQAQKCSPSAWYGLDIFELDRP